MAWVVNKTDREAFQSTMDDDFREKVVKHALSKLSFKNQDINQRELSTIGNAIYSEYVAPYLNKYEDANYSSYVFMVMLYFIKGINEMNKPYMQDSLQNDRIGINTRVYCAYRITRQRLEGNI